jgi:adenylate cyclase
VSGLRRLVGGLWGPVLALPLLAALPALSGAPPGRLLAGLDSQLESLVFRLRGLRPVPQDPLILAIDNDSLALGELLDERQRQASPLWRAMGPWPWSRALQAELAALVLERGAAQVVFNLVHSEPSRYGPADDAAFVRRLAPWRDRLVLAASHAVTEQDGVERAQLNRPLADPGWPGGLPRQGLTTVLQSPQGLSEAIPGRRWLQESLSGFGGAVPWPLAYAALAVAPPPPPLGIDFSGPAARLERVPAWQLLERPDSLWRGRTVLIGVTAAQLGDQQETPFGPMSGTELQAAALASVLEGTGRLPLAAPALSALLVGWGLLVWWALRRGSGSRPTLVISAALLALALLLLAATWGWARLRPPAAALLLAPLLGGLVRGGEQGLREQRERAYLHQLLARRISPTLLRDILREPGPIWTQVGGSRCRCVVLFTDLVGFTALSARLEPAPLFSLLNRYFEAIASAVIEQQGLVDKFIGDALMAEFGVPRSRGDAEEALAAVRAALAMQQRLEALNRELVAQGSEPLRQGIGLHLGEVIAGNLGSSERLEFTVVGAAVNLACRLESLTRQFPDQPILISGELRALLPPELPVVDLGRHALKGWPEPVAVFGLGGAAVAAVGPGAADR